MEDHLSEVLVDLQKTPLPESLADHPSPSAPCTLEPAPTAMEMEDSEYAATSETGTLTNEEITVQSEIPLGFPATSPADSATQCLFIQDLISLEPEPDIIEVLDVCDIDIDITNDPTSNPHSIIGNVSTSEEILSSAFLQNSKEEQSHLLELREKCSKEHRNQNDGAEPCVVLETPPCQPEKTSPVGSTKEEAAHHQFEVDNPEQTTEDVMDVQAHPGEQNIPAVQETCRGSGGEPSSPGGEIGIGGLDDKSKAALADNSKHSPSQMETGISTNVGASKRSKRKRGKKKGKNNGNEKPSVVLEKPPCQPGKTSSVDSSNNVGAHPQNEASNAGQTTQDVVNVQAHPEEQNIPAVQERCRGSGGEPTSLGGEIGIGGLDDKSKAALADNSKHSPSQMETGISTNVGASKRSKRKRRRKNGKNKGNGEPPVVLGKSPCQPEKTFPVDSITNKAAHPQNEVANAGESTEDAMNVQSCPVEQNGSDIRRGSGGEPTSQGGEKGVDGFVDKERAALADASKGSPSHMETANSTNIVGVARKKKKNRKKKNKKNTLVQTKETVQKETLDENSLEAHVSSQPDNSTEDSNKTSLVVGDKKVATEEKQAASDENQNLEGPQDDSKEATSSLDSSTASGKDLKRASEKNRKKKDNKKHLGSD